MRSCQFVYVNETKCQRNQFMYTNFLNTSIRYNLSENTHITKYLKFRRYQRPWQRQRVRVS